MDFGHTNHTIGAIAQQGLVRRISAAFRPYKAQVIVVGLLILVSAGLGVVNPLLIRVVFDSALFPVMVDADGEVFTGSLIGRSGYDIADKMALKIALQTVRFQRLTNAPPDAPLTTGDLIYHWHWNLNSVTNLSKRPR